MLYSRSLLVIYFIYGSESHLVVSNSFVTPKEYSLPGSSVHGISQARILEWVAVPFSRDLPKPGIKPRSLTLQADSLLSEPPEKPKYTGVGSLSLLQRIFPTQRLNPGLPHCRRILYQLSHKGSPSILEWVAYPFSSRSSCPRNQILYCRMILYH